MCKPFWMQWNLDAKTQRFPVCRVRDIALGVIKSEKDKYGRTVFEMAQGVRGRAVVGWGGGENKKESWDEHEMCRKLFLFDQRRKEERARQLPTKENLRSVPASMGG